MSKLLIVPMQIDALHLTGEKSVAGPMADFTKLPYNDGTYDKNTDTPYLGDSLATRPFAASGLHLKKGIHLHWALPDALTSGKATPEGLEFPAVPNRWLIIRTDTSTNPHTTKQWVLESDYIHPEGMGEHTRSINYPVLWPNPGRNQPYTYLGRKMPKANWTENPGAEYLISKEGHELTALGYGADPTFAAFYPNCHSVFGFYDEEATATITNYTYEVLGWYSDANKDFIKKFIDDLGPEDGADVEKVKTAIEEELQWHMSLGTGEAGAIEIPEAILCYTKQTFSTNTLGVHPGHTAEDTKVAIGNSGTEALAAYLAKDLVDKNETTLNKAQLEQALEAVILGENLEHRQLDLEHKIEEHRHAKGFKTFNAGTIWTIKPETKKEGNSQLADAQHADDQQQITLPDSMAHQLNTLNQLQAEYDQATAEIESRQIQLFSDWYKYMLAANPPHEELDAYPDMGLVRTFIKNKDLHPLQEQINATCTLRDRRNSAKATLEQLVTDYNSNNSQSTAQLQINSIGAPRYKQATDPVVLLTGIAVEPTTRHGQDGRMREDGLMECLLTKTFEIHGNTGIIKDETTQDDFRQVLQNQSNFLAIAGNIQDTDPWHPFLLEWDVENYPMKNKGNVNSQHSDSGVEARDNQFNQDFIKDNYEIDHQVPDFSPKEERSYAKTSHVFTGKSYLTPHAKFQFKNKLEAYLDKYGAIEHDTVQALTAIKETIETSNFHCLSQALGNFNEALTQYEYTLQWGIADPFPVFTEDTEFAEDVAFMLYPQKANAIWEQLKGKGWITENPEEFNQPLTAHVADQNTMDANPLDRIFQLYKNRIEGLLGGATVEYNDFFNDFEESAAHIFKYAVQPHNHFSPIRSGHLGINRLRLIDTFGIIKDILVEGSNDEPVVTIEALKVNHNRMQLLPRISQPARLKFRWLSAQNGEAETNIHPASTPICGWFLPNNLDKSLYVYDNEGKPLGQFRIDGLWESVPGVALTEIAAITNPYLQHMVQYLRDRHQEENTFMQHFSSAINNAVRRIEPESFAQHPDLAFLMGKPLALVRTKIDLQVKGLPAINQSWGSFAYDLQANERLEDNFTGVQFPIRVGEYAQYNDGVVGYLQENLEGSVAWNTDSWYQDKTFYAPQTDQNSSTHITTHHDGELNIWHALNDAPIYMTMLVDPRAKVHATTGILPVKSIELPPDQYKAILQKLSLTFRSTPILTPSNKITIPLPNEAGYEWSWLEKYGDDWKEIHAIVPKDVLVTAFNKGEEIWQELITKDWIVATPDETVANVRDVGERPMPLDDGFEDWLQRIEDLLEPHLDDQITKSELLATFDEGLGIWQELLAKKWLEESETDANMAKIIPLDQRIEQELDAPRTNLAGQVALVFEQYEITNPKREVHFHEKLELRSGWLKLSASSPSSLI